MDVSLKKMIVGGSTMMGVLLGKCYLGSEGSPFQGLGLHGVG